MRLEILDETQTSCSPRTLGGYSASVPELPGCYYEGETLSEALSNIQEAAQLWLEVASEINEEDSSIPQVALQKDRSMKPVSGTRMYSLSAITNPAAIG